MPGDINTCEHGCYDFGCKGICRQAEPQEITPPSSKVEGNNDDDFFTLSYGVYPFTEDYDVDGA